MAVPGDPWETVVEPLVSLGYASINSSCAHPPGNCGTFARNISPGGWALVYPRAIPGLLIHTWFLTRHQNMEEFIAKKKQ